MKRLRSSISISVRRHFVDKFFLTHAQSFKDKKIIDIGGKKEKKRGLFDISDYTSQVTYVNIDKSTDPDIVADATRIPLPSEACEVIIMGEILEHIPHPELVLKEAYRLLHSGGKVFVTVPFMYPIHADPYDYGRYTDYYWKEKARELGFTIEIERQGGMFAILALAVQHYFRAHNRSIRPVQIPLVKLFMWLDKKTTKPLLLDWTTGFGLVFTK